MRFFKSSMYYRSYEPPKRDEETEMLRKKRAKRARETRRSTQVSTLPLRQISGIVEGVTGVPLQHQYFEDLPAQIKIIATYRKRWSQICTLCAVLMESFRGEIYISRFPKKKSECPFLFFNKVLCQVLG